MIIIIIKQNQKKPANYKIFYIKPHKAFNLTTFLLPGCHLKVKGWACWPQYAGPREGGRVSSRSESLRDPWVPAWAGWGQSLGGQKACDAESSATLYIGMGLNLGDRVLDEVEKDSFIVLPGEGGHWGIMPSNPCPPNLGKIVTSL